jgi:hypothetical protein
MRQDILLDTDGDLLIENGDFVIGASDSQHIDHIVNAQLGEYKEHLLVGFGAINYLKTNVSEMEFKRDLKVQLEIDGYQDASIDLSGGFSKLKIEF